MKAFYELLSKNAYYRIEYEMSITGALLNQLLEKHGLSQDMIQTKKSTIDWLLEGFPETPVDVVRIIAGKLYREAGFVQDLKDHWREATDTLEEASMVFHIYRDSPYEPDEIDSSLDEDFGDKDFRYGEDGESDAPMYLSTWRYSLHGSRNEIWWTGTEEIDTFRSESDVCHAPAKETIQIEFAGKAIQILPGTIDPKDFPCLKPIQDGNYQLVPVIPTETSLIAVDGLEIFFLWDLFKEQYEKIFSLISCISDIAYRDDVSAAYAESDLFRRLSYGNRDLRFIAECRKTVVSIIEEFLFFSRDLSDGFQKTLQEAADHMIRKKNGKLSTTRVWKVSQKAYEPSEKCPFSITVDCKPVSENAANLRLYFNVRTLEGETGSIKL